MRKITAVHASSEKFNDFGSFIAVSDNQMIKPSAESDIQTFFGKLGIMECKDAIELGICIAKKRSIKVTEMEQHAKTSELLVALNGDFIAPVAPSILKDGKLVPDFDKAIAIRVNQGEGVLFNIGVWHWTPYPVNDTATVLVAFKENTPKEDFISAIWSSELVIE